jgi:hypothetical protein
MMKNDKTNFKLIANIFLLLLALVSIISCVFAWFMSNTNVDASGIKVESTYSNVYFYDEIKIVRHFAGKNIESSYLKNGDYYYEYDKNNNSFVRVNGELVPMMLTAIYPNETIEVTVWYRADKNLDGKNYQIILTDFDDTDGIFRVNYNDNYYEHSALGVFKATKSKFANITEETEWDWLLDYNGDELADTKKNRVVVASGVFNEDSAVTIDDSAYKYYESTFCIECNFEQYKEKIEHAQTNALSELMVSIGAIRIIA